jgi:glycosyltransferase involved in cell wall biosynthesis
VLPVIVATVEVAGLLAMVERSSTTGSVGPTLSVVLPNYNHSQYLPRALDALLLQERPADEIIVVDDCSTDSSAKIVREYAVKYRSIRLIENATNIGVIATLSRGLGEAAGQYVYFGAADDFVLPGFFETAVEMLKANPGAGFFFGDAILVDGHTGRTLGARPPVRPQFHAGCIVASDVARLLRQNDNFIVTGAAVFRRDATVAAGGFDENLSSFADGYLVRKIALTRGFCYAPTPVLTWCIFPDSVSRQVSTQATRAREILGKIEARLTEDADFPPWYPEAFRRRWRFATSRLAIEDDPINLELLIDMGAQNATDRTVFNCLTRLFGRNARIPVLGWLWLRFRPFSLTGLATTAFSRHAAAIFRNDSARSRYGSRPQLDPPHPK